MDEQPDSLIAHNSGTAGSIYDGGIVTGSAMMMADQLDFNKGPIGELDDRTGSRRTSRPSLQTSHICPVCPFPKGDTSWSTTDKKFGTPALVFNAPLATRQPTTG